jgi:hypothetical protein
MVILFQQRRHRCVGLLAKRAKRGVGRRMGISKTNKKNIEISREHIKLSKQFLSQGLAAKRGGRRGKKSGRGGNVVINGLKKKSNCINKSKCMK